MPVSRRRLAREAMVSVLTEHAGIKLKRRGRRLVAVRVDSGVYKSLI